MNGEAVDSGGRRHQSERRYGLEKLKLISTSDELVLEARLHWERVAEEQHQ